MTTGVNVASPLVIRGIKIKNRIAKGAMSEALAPASGKVSLGLINLYNAWGKGGLGVSITGNVMIDAKAKNEPGVVIIEDESDLAELKHWASLGKKHGMVQIVQLSHPGKQCPKGLNKETVAPSAIGFGAALSKFFPVPRELSEVEILDLVHRFGEAARICKKAGFEGIQLHGAHGYLISQFLSPIHNQRTDQWGGSIENRMRFALECYKAARSQTGEDFIVGIKLNSADFQKGGFSEEDAVQVFKALDVAGIDFIEISGGTYENPAMVSGKSIRESTVKREAYFLEFAEKIRQEVKTVLMVTGGFRTRAGMDAALASGACDLVGIARPLAVETDAPNSILAGRDVQYAVKPIKTGIGMIDKMSAMEILWYAAQFKTIARGKVPNPKLSPLLVFADYASKNVRSVLKRQLKVRA